MGILPSNLLQLLLRQGCHKLGIKELESGTLAFEKEMASGVVAHIVDEALACDVVVRLDDVMDLANGVFLIGYVDVAELRFQLLD
jgi:hypothetical protein